MDRHTLLANKWLSLSRHQANARWPKTLLELGYALHGIEHTVHVGDMNVSPDIIMVNSKVGHALVVECKSGANVDPGQDQGYARMSIGDLRGAGVPATILAHTPVYAINEEHAGRIRGHTGLPLVVFGSRRIYGVGDLGNARLTGELRMGVKLESGSEPDPDIYPFSIRDTNERIDWRVSNAVSRHLKTRPEMFGRSLAARSHASAILRIAHPLHAFFSGPHRRELRRAVEQSVARQEGRGAWWLARGARGAVVL